MRPICKILAFIQKDEDLVFPIELYTNGSELFDGGYDLEDFLETDVIYMDHEMLSNFFSCPKSCGGPEEENRQGTVLLYLYG